MTSRKIKIEPPRVSSDMSVKEFASKRNTILILRTVGGLGDILMHRMLFEDFKSLAPDCKIHFACPKIYHDAVSDHPFIDEIVDSDTVDKSQYLVSYNTSSACARYEMKMAPFADLHRSDIWATHCGVTLTRHDMHIRLTEDEQKWGRIKIDSLRRDGRPTVAVASASAMGNKNLTDDQTKDLLDGLETRGLSAFGVHTSPLLAFSQKCVPVVYMTKIREWMSLIAASDYVVSVDTAAFHCAGGMKKPVTGVFTFCNAETYGRYYRTAEFVQGPCPANYQGCYNWCSCPVRRENGSLPCRDDIEISEIMIAVDRMMERHPVRCP